MHVENGAGDRAQRRRHLFRFALPGGGAGARPARSAAATARARPTRKSNRDTEAMLVAGGELWVAFENAQYDLALPAAPICATVAAARPAPMRRWRGNAGAEAMVRLADGRFLVFSEGRERRRDR